MKGKVHKVVDLKHVAGRLGESDKIMCEYFQSDPVEQANGLEARAVAGFNEWVKATAGELEVQSTELQDLVESINTLVVQITDMDRELREQQPNPDDPASVVSYNSLVEEYNALVRRHEELAQQYRQKESLYNEKVRQFNQEQEERRAHVEAVKRDATKNVEEYKRWIKEDGPQRFSNELNILYATLIKENRREGNSVEIQEYLDRIKKIRMELGAHTKQRQHMIEGGLHIVQATLCQSEECYLTVDSAATVTTITPEMVNILDLSKHVGEEVEILLPNAIRVKAPQLVIPKIAIEKNEADYVKAVVLKESMPGVDGCLGLSFLNRFDYTIDKKGLSLRPFKLAAGSGQFDVFICHKSDDLSFAKEVFEFLTGNGYRPFLSEVSMPECHTTDYQKAIDAALEQAEHLVVVGSSRLSFEAPWVEAEWRVFEGLRRSGKKRGNMIPILCGDISTDDLPVALGRYQVLSMNHPSWKSALINYLPRYQR